MTNSGYPAIFQNKVSDALRADVGTYIFTKWEQNFPIIQLLASFTQISSVLSMGQPLYKNKGISSYKIQVNGLTVDSSPSPLLDNFDPGSRPQKLAFDVMKTNSRFYNSSLFTMGLTGAQLLHQMDSESTYDMYLKSLNVITTENIPRFLWSEFIDSLYTDIDEITSDGGKPTTLKYTDFAAMPTIDMTKDGVALPLLYQMQMDYVYATEATSTDTLVMIIDNYNFDRYLESCTKTLTASGGATVSLYGTGGFATHSLDYKHKSFINVPNSNVLLLVAPRGTKFETDGSGQPIFPVFNPKYIGFNIMPAFNGSTLPDTVAKSATVNSIIPISYGLSVESRASQDMSDETPGFYLTIYFAMLALRLQKKGQFYVKGKLKT